ncbi:MAG: diguanylate cyclase [Chloroflexi bacterium]|nr:diguanylate cyclase [Chloroflexota bacterium]
MTSFSSEQLRIDPLTGCKNYLGFLETLANHSLSDVPMEYRSIGFLEKSWINETVFSAVFFIDMNDLRNLNQSKGFKYGDSAIHWMGILLQEESNSEVFRIGGDDFIVLLKIATREGHLELAERIIKRMEREAGQLGFPDAAADMALIFLDQSPTSLDTMLIKMGEAMATVKNHQESHFMAFNAIDFKIQAQTSNTWRSKDNPDVSHEVRWISKINIYQVLEMGRILDDARQEAFTDAISNLPNMKAALHNLQKSIQNSTANHRPFSVLLIDGDNIRAYNSINYAAGDEMIREMSAVFKNNLRPSDFVARWRSGDEFIVVLPDTSIEGAQIIGERFRLAVKEASKGWSFPTTISIGVASYPIHGDDVIALIDKAEAANKHAKDQGKDRVVLAD